MNISPEQANVLRQWFDSLQDTHPGYLEQKDYELAAELYKYQLSALAGNASRWSDNDNSHNTL